MVEQQAEIAGQRAQLQLVVSAAQQHAQVALQCLGVVQQGGDLEGRQLLLCQHQAATRRQAALPRQQAAPLHAQHVSEVQPAAVWGCGRKQLGAQHLLLHRHAAGSMRWEGGSVVKGAGCMLAN